MMNDYAVSLGPPIDVVAVVVACIIDKLDAIDCRNFSTIEYDVDCK